jgi:hypothetical protein
MELKITKMKILKPRFKLFLTLLFIAFTQVVFAQIFIGQKGAMKLRGDAPQETITAESATLIGKLDASTKRFNFKQALNAFSFSKGDLQKKHAEESYFEVDKFPNALFTGEIINDINLLKDGTYNVTVKGKFSLHGVVKEMKIPAVLIVVNGVININCKFSIFLSDFKIKVPKLVSLKVSSEFTVDFKLSMSKDLTAKI